MSLKIASRLIILISVALGVLFVANQKYSFVGNYGLNRELGALLSTRQRHAQDTLRGDGDSCLPPKTAIVFQDMHDGDKKTVREDGDHLVIEPYGNDEKWTVKAKLDKPNCRAMVDFRVPGKPSPPPTDLLLSIWIEFRIPSEGEVISKNTIEFTDPSGKLNPDPTFPLNTWVMLLKNQGAGSTQ